MSRFSNKSMSKLSTCHPSLRAVLHQVVLNYDCTILQGVRSYDEQLMLFNSGRSKTMNSKHLPYNDGLSRAVDVVPYPIAWGEAEQQAIMTAFQTRNADDLKRYLNDYKAVMARFYHFGGYVQAVAKSMNVDLRWGGDWDSDKQFDDQTFHDLPHFELL